MYKEIIKLLLKFGIKLDAQDLESLDLLKVIINYKKGDVRSNYIKKSELKKKKILIVDSNKNFTDLLKELLKDFFEVEQIYDGSQIFDKVRVTKPFLIILENDLPDITGVKLLPKLRKTFKDQIKIILYSSKSISQLKEENQVKNIKVDNYFRKPKSLESLFKKVIEWELLSPK